MAAPAITGTPEARVWSPMQLDIFAAVAALPEGKHIVIEALAGSGKSTTIEECVESVPLGKSILVCAFNKPIADALDARMPAGVDVMTTHALGRRIVIANTGREEVDCFYVNNLAKIHVGPAWHQREERTAVAKLVSLAKSTLAEPVFEALDEMADVYGVEIPKGKRHDVIHVAVRLLLQCMRATEGPIDFDDMIWLPHVRDLAAPTWDYVFVDETQDLNAAQLSLVKRVAGDTGRIVAVGDRRQAIYGFRGADREAIPRMIAELKATTLPLSITYRCPVQIVREANKLVPELQARPSAPAGIVRSTTVESLRASASPGDMVLSRTNAPLVGLCYSWLAAGRRAVIQGRDVGIGLITWIKNTKLADNAQAGYLVRAVREWRIAEVNRLTEAERDTQSVIDKADCLEALCEGCRNVGEVISKCEQLFGDAAKGDARGAILLSSTHRAKGLEADRVWLLRDTYMRWPGSEEANLLYVAITRSKHELIYVHDVQPEVGEFEESF